MRKFFIGNMSVFNNKSQQILYGVLSKIFWFKYFFPSIILCTDFKNFSTRSTRLSLFCFFVWTNVAMKINCSSQANNSTSITFVCSTGNVKKWRKDFRLKKKVSRNFNKFKITCEASWSFIHKTELLSRMTIRAKQNCTLDESNPNEL